MMQRSHHKRMRVLLALLTVAGAGIESGPNAENTIVVLWSDHGYLHGEKLDWGKHTLWERTSNVPFIWAGPGIAKGAAVDATVSLIDVRRSRTQRRGGETGDRR